MANLKDALSKVSFPLGGDVTQAINPWSWWLRSMGQFGFININEMASSDQPLEQRIVGQVASYGKQLGRVEEALEVLLARMPREDLTAEEARAMGEFAAMRREIAAVRHGYLAVTEGGVEAFIRGLQALRAHDPAAYGRVRERLQAELKNDSKG